VLISSPADTAKLAAVRATKPAARLVIQNRCGVGSVYMPMSIVGAREKPVWGG
jgi:hypothetical protein